MNNRTKLKVITVLHGVMTRARRVCTLPRNPVTDVEKPVQTHRVLSTEDVMALVRAAASEQDAAIYLTAAFTGLRRALARLGQRDFTGDDDLVFHGIAGTYLDTSALYRRYKAALRRAGLRDLRFHDLRHTFGTQDIGNPRMSMLQRKE